MLVDEARPGDILVFKGDGMAFNILSRLLKLFDRKWDRWGWHMAIVTEVSDALPLRILEASSDGVRLSYLLNDDYRIYRWLDDAPISKFNQFIREHLGAKYDIAIYFWTSLAVIVRHYFNHPIPKLLNRRFSCWELAQEFTAFMGKPLQSRYDVVIITDMLKALEG